MMTTGHNSGQSSDFKTGAVRMTTVSTGKTKRLYVRYVLWS
jgi:hypothetical protein